MPEMTPAAAALATALESRELQQRHLAPLQLREQPEGGTAWEVEGIGVPYGQETELWPGVYEQFAPGAVDLAESERALLFYGHREAIGRVIEQRNDEDGWHPRATISDTAQGRDAHTLAVDGVLTHMSVGFVPIEWETREDEDGTHITHTRVRVAEVSLTPLPAYQGAELTAVRHAPTAPPTIPERTPDVPETMTTEETLTDVRAQLTELQRRMELGQFTPPPAEPTHPLLQFRSMGEFVKAAAKADETATTAYAQVLQAREYAGGTTADVDRNKNTWVGDLVAIVEAQQKVASSFLHTYDLPDEGMGVDFGVLGQNTLTVDQQAKEGDDLPFGKITVGHDTAGVGTYGGYTQLSRQEIERMPVNMVDLAWQGLSAAYGQRIEGLVRKVFTEAHTRALASTTNRVALRKALADATSIDWLAAVLDLAELFDARARQLTGIKASRDTFLQLASVESTDRMLVVADAPAGAPAAAGTLSVSIPEANLYGVRVELVPNWTGANMSAYDRTAIRTQEAPGAPFRLQDGNVINLSEAFSVYGYAASYQQKADAIVAVDLTGTPAEG